MEEITSRQNDGFFAMRVQLLHWQAFIRGFPSFSNLNLLSVQSQTEPMSILLFLLQYLIADLIIQNLMQVKTTTSTVLQHQQQQNPHQQTSEQPTLILRLQNKPVPRVSWTEDTIDNEHMNKKKSNLCCIYHRPGESSSDTCTSDDDGNALERDRHTKHLHKQVCSKRTNKGKQQQKPKKQDPYCKGPHKHEKKFADEQ